MKKKREFLNIFITVICVFMLSIGYFSEISAKTNTQIRDSGLDYVNEQSFGKDYHMTGLFSKIQKSFEVGNWTPKKSLLKLELSTTQLVDQNISDMTISINDIRFYSAKIPVTDGQKRNMEIEIPVSHLREGTNVIKIEGYIRTVEGLPCVDDVSTGNWMNVFKDSSIAIQYTPNALVNNIGDFYRQFSSIEAMDYSQSAVAVSKNSTTPVLSTALEVMAGMSSNPILNYNQTTLCDIDNLADIQEKQYIIYVETYENLPEAYKHLMADWQKQMAEKSAVIALTKTEQNQDLLIITGVNDKAIRNAGKLMGYKEVMSQIADMGKQILETQDVLMKATDINQYMNLTESDSYVSGPFRQDANFYTSYPSNRALAKGSQVHLNVRYSENLDFDRSLLTVYINDIPIGSRKLSKDKAQGHEINFDIPTDVKVSGSFNLKVAFDLEIKDLWCTLRQGEMPWGLVTKESMLKLNTVDIPHMIFENYPSPFIKDGIFNKVAFIIPDNLEVNELKSMGSIMLTMGRHLKSNIGDFQVRRVAEVGDLAGYNVITFGTYDSNKYIRDLNSKLFFKFSQDGKSILSNEKLIIDEGYGAKLGTIQLLKSENSTKINGILVISGCNHQGMLDAASYLETEEGLWKLYGDGLIATGKDLSIYRFKEDNNIKLSYSQELIQRPDLIIFTTIVGIVLIISVVAIILLLIKYRKSAKYEKK